MLYLASQSPRRRQLLTEAGFDHCAMSPGVDDADLHPPGGLSPAVWVAGLAHLKARAGVETLRRQGSWHEGDVLIGADTVCVGSDSAGEPQILAAPRDANEARVMLDHWQEREHQVLTGVCILSARAAPGREDGHRHIFVDRAWVRWGRVPAHAIDEYLATAQWTGKAGAYNLSERLAAGWPITFDGDPTTIMGLPMRRLAPLLRSPASSPRPT